MPRKQILFGPLLAKKQQKQLQRESHMNSREKGAGEPQVDLNFLCPSLQTHLSPPQPPPAPAGFVFNIKLSVHDS